MLLRRFQGSRAARLVAARREIADKLCFFVAEKQPTSIAIGWSDPVCGRELHPLKSSGFLSHFIASCLSSQ
jgi:hypothetical protein